MQCPPQSCLTGLPRLKGQLAWVIYTWRYLLVTESSKDPLVILNFLHANCTEGYSVGTNVPRESKRLHLVLRNQAPQRSRQHAAHHTTIFPRLGSDFTGNEPLRRKYRPDEPITDRQNRRAASCSISGGSMQDLAQ